MAMGSSLAEFKTMLASRGYRLTRARHAVLRALVGAGGHLSADELAELLRESGSEVGRMTVYRTLDLLTELGLVRPIYQGTGAAHYILMVDGHHHHLVCTRCHAVVEIDSCIVKNIERQVMSRSGFEVHGHLLEVFGICEDCRQELP
jgi:Fur family ferric uptake transcriptional regulator